MKRHVARALATLLALAALVACKPEAERLPPEGGSAQRITQVLGGDAQAGFERAVAPRPLRFPDDHGPHPSFQSEWWYLTGNLDGNDGRRYGFQLTFFRFALRPPSAPVAERSRWRSDQLWMAHFALSDVDGRRFHSFERFSRGALDLAGARPAPFGVWLEDWSIRSQVPEKGLFPLRVVASDGPVSIDLVLHAGRPMVLQGDEGLSRKSSEPGNASYYYSYTRLPARGQIDAGEGVQAVSGRAWLDREWSTSALAADQSGWDWFALQLDDGRDLMLYRLRRHDGSAHAASAGVLVGPDAQVRHLAAEQFVLTPAGTWRSPDGESYPQRWRVEVPSESIDLSVVPALQEQVHSGTLRYYEGAVDARGHGPGGPLSGRGYLEMTPY